MVKTKQLQVSTEHGNAKSNIKELLEKASEVGILNISAGGMGISERIIKNAIKTTEIVEKYCAENAL
jgi:hypothetical protein